MNCDSCRWARLRSQHGPRYRCAHPVTRQARPLVEDRGEPHTAYRPAAAWKVVGSPPPARAGIIWAALPGKATGNFWPWSFLSRHIHDCCGWEGRLDTSGLEGRDDG